MLRSLVLLSFCAASIPALAEEPIDFNFEVKPLLSDRCYVCHGPDEGERQADLRLDQRDGLSQASESGNVDHVVKSGNPDESEFWLRINSDDPDVMMPPPDSNLRLTDAEKQLLKRWIEQGAPWEGHWSVQAFEKTELQDKSPSEAIDHFVGKRLAAAGLARSHEASPEALLRRVTFDLTGLPPTTADMDSFLRDPSESAFDAVVDRLLASPRFGERMAAQWLDAARYSDTYGYQVDRDRFVWPYRDWVIRAFNRNLPYDEFITQQLAGDLLEDATDDQILATTFNRLHPQKVEGGSVPEEFRIEYVADRTQTFATAMLGLTFECARCHDHKYDPIPQREYYQLTAFFDKIDEAGLYSYFTPSIPTPTLMLVKDQGKQELEKLRGEVAEESRKLDEIRDALRGTFRPGTSPKPEGELLGQVEHRSFDEWDSGGPNKSVPGVKGTAVKLSGDDGIGLKTGNFPRQQPFSVSLWLNIPTRRERAVVFHRSRAWTDAGSRGYQLLIEDGKLSASLIHFWPGNAIRVKSVKEFPTSAWHHVTWTYDGSSRASGLRLYFDGRPLELEIVRDNLYKHITGGGGDNITIGQRFRDLGLSQGVVDEFRIFDRELTEVEVRQLIQLDQAIDFEEPSAEARFAHFLSQQDAYRDQLGRLQAARKALNEKLDAFEEIMVMQEMRESRQTYVLTRGAYDARGEAVDADTPTWLPPMSAELPKNRLGLAQWLTSSDHPLAARVVVNRLWQSLFGEGLVRTPEDFGSQGQLPTHPMLLDWLARDFLESGWDTKRMLKQIVLSRTYRQSSVASREMVDRDPENRLYGRAPSYRWPAEMLRDQALHAGGLLVEELGGPPAKPYELEVSFKPAKPDAGNGLYRRSVYTYWRRTGPAPVMMALDAAKRDVCRVKRSRTSSPLQTLVLMNSPQFVEAARALAVHVSNEKDSLKGQLRLVFRTLTARQPSDAEYAVMERLFDNLMRDFTAREGAAEAYLKVGKFEVDAATDAKRLAALASVANALLGYDECMMKR